MPKIDGAEAASNILYKQVCVNLFLLSIKPRTRWIQGSMVAEVEAMRKSVEEERQRLADKCAALDRERRQADAATRAEGDRLTEQVYIQHILSPLLK